VSLREVRKRSRSELSKRQNAILYAVLLLIGSILALWLLLPLGGRAPARRIEVPEDTTKLQFTAPEEDLLSFTIYPRDGEPYTIVHDQGTYQLEDQPNYSLDMTMIKNMIQSLLYLESVDTISSAQGLELNDFGLEQGSLGVAARYAHDRQLHFVIGNRIPSDIPRDYLLITGDPNLYAVAVDVREALDHKLNLLHIVPSINFTADLLDTIHFEGKETLSLHRVAQDLWEITEPVHYPANLGQVQWMLRQVAKMRLTAYVADALPKDLAPYGLDNPRCRIRFVLSESLITTIPSGETSPVIQQVAAQELVFAIGDEIPGKGFYCLYNDVIYLASDLSMGFLLEHELQDYISKSPIDVPLNRLSQLIASLPQGGVSFDLSLVEHILPNNEIALDEQGNILYDYLITSAGREIEPAVFVETYASLMAIKAAGTLPPDYSVLDQAAILSLSLRFEGQKRQIAFYPYDVLHLAAEVNGHLAYYVSRDSVEAALSSLAASAD